MPLPFTAKRFVAEPSNLAQARWATQANDILPFLITLQYVDRETIELFRGLSVLVYLPHTENSIYTVFGMSTPDPVVKLAQRSGRGSTPGLSSD